MAAKIKLLKELLTSVSLASLVTSINTESNNVFAAVVPSGSILSNTGGTPSTLTDVAADQRWAEVDAASNPVLPIVFINAPIDNWAIVIPR